MLRVEIAADDFLFRRVHRNRKSDRVIDFLRLARPIRILRRKSALTWREFASLAPPPSRGFSDDVKNQIGIFLLAGALGSIIVLIRKRVRQAMVVAADITMVGSGILGSLFVVLFGDVRPIQQTTTNSAINSGKRPI